MQGAWERSPGRCQLLTRLGPALMVERKSVEAIALAQGVDRRQRQHFVGVSHGKPKEETLLAMEALGSQERWLFVYSAERHTPLQDLQSGGLETAPR